MLRWWLPMIVAAELQNMLQVDDECVAGDSSVPCALEQLQLRTNLSTCYFKEIFLAGKVKEVSHFPDIEVQVVESFPDLEVKKVSHFPDRCGEWQMVDHFPDFTVKFVRSFPDVKIRYVTSFPGLYRR